MSAWMARKKPAADGALPERGPAKRNSTTASLFHSLIEGLGKCMQVVVLELRARLIPEWDEQGLVGNCAGIDSIRKILAGASGSCKQQSAEDFLKRRRLFPHL